MNGQNTRMNSSSGVTLSNLKLYTGDPLTGVTGGLNPSVCDNLIVVNLDDSITTFFYYSNPALGYGWVNANAYTLSDDVIIPPGSAFFINRQAPSGFTWTVPAQ